MRPQKGVTLIELLIAMGILAILIVILYSVFTVSLKAWKKAGNLFESATVGRVVLDRICSEMKNAIIKPGNDFYCRGFDQSAQSGWRTNSKADEFYFIAAVNPNEYDNMSDLCEVGYWVSDRGTASSNDDSLYRFYVTDDRGGSSPDFDFDFSTGASNEFSTNVTDLQFVYYDASGNPSNSWDSSVSGKPSRIDISITVETGAGDQTSNPEFIQKSYTATVAFPN